MKGADGMTLTLNGQQLSRALARLFLLITVDHLASFILTPCVDANSQTSLYLYFPMAHLMAPAPGQLATIFMAKVQRATLLKFAAIPVISNFPTVFKLFFTTTKDVLSSKPMARPGQVRALATSVSMAKSVF